ncbi:MAG: phosphoglucosamine mutase [Clostridia bacterium]|nr:phosphoglucosamine mutase [Clostridia bacterium]
MGNFFGTDGVRGVANTELTPMLAYNLGRFGAYVLTKNSLHTPKILVGKDTRISSDMLECALVSGILSVGAQVVLLGVVPTPAVSYLTRKYKADAGIVISASHNPFQYNGIKFFNQSGFKLPDETEEEIESYILGKKVIEDVLTGEKIGRKTYLKTAVEDYVDFALKCTDTDFSDFKIAIDCSNGANFEAAPLAFKRLGAQVSIINNAPDGININKDCGSVHVEKLCKYVKDTGSNIGLAFDGDADRLIAVDEKGCIIDGDVIIGLLALDLKKKNKLKNNIVVGTVMSNMGLSLTCKENGISFIQARVGDRYVLEKMLEKGSVLGGEQSGHIISLLDNTTGDALISAIRLLTVLKESGKPASVLRKAVTILPQVLVNATIKNEYKTLMLANKDVVELISRLEQKYGSEGRILVRPSGTEPVVRIMIEGKNTDEMQEDAARLAALLEEKFSV